MQNRQLGSEHLNVSAIGLGCMSLGMTGSYTSSIASDDEAVRLLHRALEFGVTLLDSADVYGESEQRLGKALRGRRQQAVVATKFGIDNSGGPAARTINGRPEYVRACCEQSLQRLGIETIDLYYQHRIDPMIPIEETIGAMADLIRQGKVRHLGLSEPAAATIRRAQKVHPITAVQSEYSLWTRDVEAEILPTLRELRIGLVAYSPIGRGMLAGRFNSAQDLAPDDWRRGAPRFQGANFTRNLSLVDQVKAIARRKGCSAAQLALAWLLAQGQDIVPIPGTSNLTRLEENVGAASLQLTSDELAQLDRVMPLNAAVGSRYTAAGMTEVNR